MSRNGCREKTFVKRFYSIADRRQKLTVKGDETVGRIVQLLLQHQRQLMICFLTEESDLADLRFEIVVRHRHGSHSDVRTRLIAAEFHLTNARRVFTRAQFDAETSYGNGSVEASNIVQISTASYLRVCLDRGEQRCAEHHRIFRVRHDRFDLKTRFSAGLAD